MPQIKVLNTSAKNIKSITLPKEIFSAQVRPALMAQAVKVYLSNQRQAPAKTKSRGEVKVSKSKIWRQKGTGRARHGSKNAPIFVGGAKAHGPTGKQNYRLKLAKKMKQLSLFSALTSQLQDKNIMVVDGLEKLAPKTRKINLVFNKLLKNPKKISLILDKPIDSIRRSTNNLPYITISMAQNLNTYNVLNANTLIFIPNSIKTLKDHYLKAKI